MAFCEKCDVMYPITEAMIGPSSLGRHSAALTRRYLISSFRIACSFIICLPPSVVDEVGVSPFHRLNSTPDQVSLCTDYSRRLVEETVRYPVIRPEL